MIIIICTDISLREQIQMLDHHVSRTITYYAPLTLTYFKNGTLIQNSNSYSVRCSISADTFANHVGYEGQIQEQISKNLWYGVGGAFRQEINNYVFVYPKDHSYFKL